MSNHHDRNTVPPASEEAEPVVLRGHKVSVKINDRRVVDDVSLNLRSGQVTAIVGESGSGKSQLVKALTGLSAGTVSGSVRFDGAELVGASEAALRSVRGRRIAYVFQDPLSALHPFFRIETQLTEVTRAHLGLGAKAARDRAVEMLTRVQIPEPRDKLRAFPHELSGGQRQRVVIAMTLMAEPTLLVADEPTTALDVTVQLGILDLIRDLCNDHGLSCIFITHDIAVAARIAEETLVMQAGRIVERGETKRVLTTPDHPYTRTLLSNTPRLDATLARQQSNQGDPLLEVRSLSVRYPTGGLLNREAGFQAVSDVSFSIAPGETLGVVGESGSGKSSIARALVRLAPISGGEVLWRSYRVDTLSDHAFRPLRRDIQTVFQDPFASLNPRMRVRDLIAEPLWTHAPGMTVRERQDKIAHALTSVSLEPDIMRRYRHELSGGQAQRVSIARAIVCEPKLLICDEAVSALDVTVQARILDLITDLQAKFGLAILFITHDLAVVRQVADRILVLHAGKVSEMTTRERLFEAPQAAYTRQLLASVLTLPG